jgi:lysozyme
MKMSKNGLKLLAEWEGDILHVYKDQAGLKTIGIGHLLTKTELSTGNIIINGEEISYSDDITEQQSLDLLSQDMSYAQETVNEYVKVPLNQNQFDALVSFTFNCGNGAFMNSTLLKVLNDSCYDMVPDELKKWTHAGGKVCDGLIVRRRNEIKLWNIST